MRIDGYAGDDWSYAGYLYQILSGISLAQCIAHLEKQVETRRKRYAPNSIPEEQLVASRDAIAQHTSRPVNQRFNPIDHNIRGLAPKFKELPVEQWNPHTDYKRPPPRAPKAHSPKAPEAGPPRWEIRTTTFFQELPTSEEGWMAKRKQVGLVTQDHILEAADILETCVIPSMLVESATSMVESHQGDLLHTFATTCGGLMVKGKFQQNLTHFMSLVFIATCCVALKYGHPPHLVYSAQREFNGAFRGKKCEAGEKRLDMDRSAVLWLLKEMQRQFRRGLQHRAFELFLNAGRPLSFYTECPKKEEENAEFTEKIPLPCRVPKEVQASLPFWIPYFVTLWTGWSYTEVCKALEVDLLAEQKDFDQIRYAHTSRKLYIPVETDPTNTLSPRPPAEPFHHIDEPDKSSDDGESGSDATSLGADVSTGFHPINTSSKHCRGHSTTGQPLDTSRGKRRKLWKAQSGIAGLEQQQTRSYTEPPPDANIEETSSPSHHSLPLGRGPEAAIGPTFIQQASRSTSQPPIAQNKASVNTEPAPDTNTEETSSSSQHALPPGHGPVAYTTATIDPTLVRHTSSNADQYPSENTGTLALSVSPLTPPGEWTQQSRTSQDQGSPF
ncbi:hypothetical protein B0I35DRAFT_465552, partial [Stachybotrys elegans]